jgi:DNA-binding transcriptional MerR regulator
MAEAGYLTIGKVVRRLQAQYPDLSVSKVRYLEDEGLLDPSRTSGGYRLYSPKDIKRLETILYLQKQRFLPLSVIKDELKAADEGRGSSSFSPATSDAQVEQDDEETSSKLHAIEHMPDIAGVSVAFVRQLSEVGLITLQRSPHGRDLVDGHDLSLIRAADALRRFGIEPRNLRQYVSAANRESAMFEQALVPYVRRAGEDFTEVQRAELSQAFDQILSLTDYVRGALIRRTIKDSLKGLSD